jgi:hypothetical protein
LSIIAAGDFPFVPSHFSNFATTLLKGTAGRVAGLTGHSSYRSQENSAAFIPFDPALYPQQPEHSLVLASCDRTVMILASVDDSPWTTRVCN